MTGMLTSDECKAHAEWCREQARAETDPAACKQLEDLAASWEQLRDELERLNQPRAKAAMSARQSLQEAFEVAEETEKLCKLGRRRMASCARRAQQTSDLIAKSADALAKSQNVIGVHALRGLYRD